MVIDLASKIMRYIIPKLQQDIQDLKQSVNYLLDKVIEIENYYKVYKANEN